MDLKLKTAGQSLDDVINILELADVVTNVCLTGSIRKYVRVLNSKKEDIVLNCSASSAEQITKNYINVNIHVPNLVNQPGGTPNSIDNTQPNSVRMNEIVDHVCEVLDGYHGYDFFLNLETAGDLIPDGDNWYMNIGIWYNYLRKEK
ncbi:hypothetical protein [Sphingobacterium cellulitidis]|uniref:hypothetical protein n=1 Tax=Sphingobacterium cellulitidis TaxID=1768011 RepID=UPI000B943C73|nr:hypothetical protein CHT99_15615 [Sphingobacterium cellulitidis]